MTASTFVLGGIATRVPLYIFEREARFTLDDRAADQVERAENDLHDADVKAGQPIVPAGVVEKLRQRRGRR